MGLRINLFKMLGLPPTVGEYLDGSFAVMVDELDIWN